MCLVSNAAFQMSHESLDEISDEEWDYTFRLNVGAYLPSGRRRRCRTCSPGSSVIGSSSVNSDMPSPDAGAVRRHQGGDRQLLGQPGAAAGGEGYPGEQRGAGTDLDAADSGHDAARRRSPNFGDDTPLGRAGQPAELAPVYVLLASDEGSYISGARVGGHRRPTDPLNALSSRVN